jgi:hypothetical protein
MKKIMKKTAPIISIIKDSLQGNPNQNNIDEILHFPLCVIYVRPKTNMVGYERDILLAMTQSQSISEYILPQYIYMANVTGALVEHNNLVINHNPVRYEFALFGKELVGNYPEMISEFENRFKEKFEYANIIGSFEALEKLNLSPKELLETVVSRNNFLKLYGQSIKKIGNYYVVNYDVPGIQDQYNAKNYQDVKDDKQANIFVLAVRFMPRISFQQIKEGILEQFVKSNRISLTGEEAKNGLKLIGKLDSVCHISSNHLLAMFDLFEYYYQRDNEILDIATRLGFSESRLWYWIKSKEKPIIDVDQLKKASFNLSPLGRMLIESGVSKHQLLLLKCNPLVYMNENDGSKRLVNIFNECNGKTLLECRDVILNIDWQDY